MSEEQEKTTFYQLAKVRKNDNKLTLLPIVFKDEYNAKQCANYLGTSLTYGIDNIMVLEYQKEL